MASLGSKRLKVALILLFGAGVLFVLFFFKNILLYFIIAVVITLVGRPMAGRLEKIKIGKRKLPPALCSAVTMLSLFAFAGGVISLFIPLLIDEIQLLSTIDPNKLVESIGAFTDVYVKKLQAAGVKIHTKELIDQYVTQNLTEIFNADLINNLFSLLTGFSDVLAALFSASFIAFFFMQNPQLADHFITAVVPEHYYGSVERTIANTKNLLRRYFIGLIIQTSIVTTLIAIGLTLLGVRNALTIAAFAGLVNIIPYLGPLMGQGFAIIITATNALHGANPDPLSTQILTVMLTLGTVNMIDTIVLQPAIYSSSVKAHPLEIFIVILMAARLAGIGGMLAAVPTYTVLRVLVSEFSGDLKRLKNWLFDFSPSQPPADTEN